LNRGPAWKFARALKAQGKLLRAKQRWYQRNRHNETVPVNLFDIEKVTVGNYTYGPLHVIDGNGPSRLAIGSYCSIAASVAFILNGEHPTQTLTTFPLRAFVLHNREVALTRGDIIVDDDVWIGHAAIILSGVRIGRGSVVAAGAVVTSDVDPYTIVAGVPAKPVNVRFEKAVIERLKGIDLTKLQPPFVSSHLALLENTLDEAAIRELEQLIGQPCPTVDR
jgi:acetyltransferase-like isoleucine patch superfamily enzyme